MNGLTTAVNACIVQCGVGNTVYSLRQDQDQDQDLFVTKGRSFDT